MTPIERALTIVATHFAKGKPLATYLCDQVAGNFAPLLGIATARERLLEQLRSGAALTPVLIVGMHRDLAALDLRQHPRAKMALRILQWPGCQYLFVGHMLEQIESAIAAALQGASHAVPTAMLIQAADVRRVAHSMRHSINNQANFLSGWASSARDAQLAARLPQSFAELSEHFGQEHAAAEDRLLTFASDLQPTRPLVDAYTQQLKRFHDVYMQVAAAGKLAVQQQATAAFAEVCDEGLVQAQQLMAQLDQIIAAAGADA